MHLLKQHEQVAIFDPTNPNQRVIASRVGVPGGWASFYFNEVPVTANLQGLRGGLGLSWAGLPSWVQMLIVGGGAAVAGFFTMKRYGDSFVKPQLRKIGINLSGLGRARRRRR